MKNNYGFVYIDLGEQDFSDADITATLSEETKKILSELCVKINQVDSDNIGINTITKIPYIHLHDKAESVGIRTIATLNTNDDGVGFVDIDFSFRKYNYQLSVSGADDIAVLLIKTEFAIEE